MKLKSSQVNNKLHASCLFIDAEILPSVLRRYGPGECSALGGLFSDSPQEGFTVFFYRPLLMSLDNIEGEECGFD